MHQAISSVSVSDVLDRYKERKVGLTVENQYDATKIKRAEVVLKEPGASCQLSEEAASEI